MIQKGRSASLGNLRPARAQLADGKISPQLEIGIINNMSGGAMQATTRQFYDLLSVAAQGLTLQVKVVSPFVIPRTATDDCVVLKQRETAERLWASKFDGLIVTGTEPKAARLIDEPCLPFLTKLVEWSEQTAISVVWSCLATQAAVYHLDGIERHPLDAKLSGLFECEHSEHHSILAGYPSKWIVPHSRYNDLPERVLISGGYQILTRSPTAGVDTFTKRSKSLHFFLQGHLEYDAGVLAREYRRDIRRYLAAETDRYPALPTGYFDNATAAALIEFREKALTNRELDVLASYPREASVGIQDAPWRSVAVQFYRNWLVHLASCKAAQIHTPKSQGTRRDHDEVGPSIAEGG